MSKKLYEEANISAIASAIRSKNGSSSLYSVEGMAGAILSISANPVLQSVIFTSNGEYEPPSGIDGFDNVIVSVPSSAGVLVSKSISLNGTYNAFLDDNADGYSEVVVSVSSEGNYYYDILIGRLSGKIIDTNLSSIGSYPFQHCIGITEIDFPECLSIGPYTFCNCSNLSNIAFPKCKFIGSNAFLECSALVSADFPECTNIEGYAFRSCNNLAVVSFPECVTIRSDAFLMCTSLISVYFPKCISISMYAFQSCYRLVSVSFPTCLTIDHDAFQNCSALSFADFPTCTDISSYAFRSCGLISINLPECSNIGSNAFLNCKIAEIVLPKCKTLGSYAFQSCKSLASVYLTSSSVVSISTTDVFQSTPLSNSSYLGYFGSIFVPESLVSEYKSHNIWKLYSDRITAYTEP